MNITRARALAILGAAAMLPRCAGRFPIRIGSKNFTESIVIAEIYAQALEGAGLTIQRRFNLGSTQIVLSAMRNGVIDIYPEYTGTALIDVLHKAPVSDPKLAYHIVKDAFSHGYGIDWLEPSPMDDSQGIATTAHIASRYRLRTLSDLARVSSQLRLATIPEFLTRADGLPGLQKLYGGFNFASVKSYDIALKYQALLSGQADVATAFTTDGAIASNHLLVLDDDKHLWPPYNVAPLIRAALNQQDPRIGATLNAISASITSSAAQAMNASVERDGNDPTDVATQFVKAHTR